MVGNSNHALQRACEPTLDELMAEPIVQLIMQRDNVDGVIMRGDLDRLRDSYRRLSA